jgi:para-nitrobenzyl esterase
MSNCTTPRPELSQPESPALSRQIKRALLLVFSSLFFVTALAHADTVIKTEAGQLNGSIDGDTIKFLGIPYAAPPVGSLRWKAPRTPARWQGVRDATIFGDRCAQTTVVGEFGAPSKSEDCLFLNVFVPNRPAIGKKLPVMFWIPGGGLFAGSSNEYNAKGLVEDGNVIVVTMNYRLGVLGFFAHPDIDADGTHALVNYGLLDQQFALQWVRRNIASFGGDAGNVTIFGESAGAVSVYGHLASPASAGLFHKAILESGLTFIAKPNLVVPLAEAVGLGQRFAAAMGCKENAATCLRALPVEQIIGQQMPFLAGLVTGGIVVPEALETALRAGRFNRVPVINGTNHDEWRWPVARTELRSGKPMQAEQYRPALIDFFGTPAAQVGVQYPLAKFRSPSEALAASQTDAYFACSALKSNESIARYAPVYGYEFNYADAPMYMPKASFPYGAAHTVELQFIFPQFHGGSGTLHELSVPEKALGLTMRRYWTNFAKSGNPNRTGLPAWPKFSRASDLVMSMNLPKPAPMDTFRSDHQCDFWNSALQ